MIRTLRILSFVIMLLVACRERNSLFDPQSDSFTSPPPVFLAYPIGGWYTNTGYLVGIRMQVDFAEQFSRSLPIGNIMYQYDVQLASEGVTVPTGNASYTVDLISQSILDIGEYCIKIYFAEIAIGSCPFDVVEDTTGRLMIEGVCDYDTLKGEY